MKFSLLTLLPLSLLVHSVSAVDSDGDGLDDSVETNTGIYVSSNNTGTDPLNPDSDGDGKNDGYELGLGRITFTATPADYGSARLLSENIAENSGLLTLESPKEYEAFRNLVLPGLNISAVSLPAYLGCAVNTYGNDVILEIFATPPFQWETGPAVDHGLFVDGQLSNGGYGAINIDPNSQEFCKLVSLESNSELSFFSEVGHFSDPNKPNYSELFFPNADFALGNFDGWELAGAVPSFQSDGSIYIREWSRGGEVTTQNEILVGPQTGLVGVYVTMYNPNGISSCNVRVKSSTFDWPDNYGDNLRLREVQSPSGFHRHYCDLRDFEGELVSIMVSGGEVRLSKLEAVFEISDTDGDGLSDSVETSTGIYVSETDTGTDPNNADSDGDGVPDGLEITEGTDPTNLNDFNSFSTGLIAYYPFDGNANDESGNEVNGQTADHVSFSRDRFGSPSSALRIEGERSNIDGYGVTGSGIHLQNSSVSISFWYQKQVDDYHDWVIGVGDNGDCWIVNIDYSAPTGIGWGVWNNESSVNLNPPLVIGQWCYVVVTYDKENATQGIYVDGKLLLEGSANYSFTGTSNFKFGASGITLDNLRFYDRALSTSEVSALYYSEPPQFQIIEGDFTWHEAKADAENRGGRLAVLNSQEKIDAANDQLDSFGSWPNLWIGLTDEASEGNWIWIDGTELVADNWEASEPNNIGDEDAAIIVTAPSAKAQFWQDGNVDLKFSYLLEIVAPEPLAPVLDLDTFYESNSGESITIDATPSNGYPTTYTYQWSFKAVGSSSYFVIPSNFGGTAANYLISGDSGNNGIWKVAVTNDTGTTTAEFNYRVYTDSDSDGLSDGREEFVLGTDPNNNDSDSDTLLDGAETNTGIWVSTSDTGTDPLSSDTDEDGLLDGVETNTGEYVDASDTGTDPNNSDTDEDSLLDGAETNTGIFVDTSDTGTNPLEVDSDFDGILDGYETATGTWVSTEDTGTNPTRGDSDGDGLPDGAESNTGTFVGLSNTGTDPNSTDSDGDGFTDDYEINTSYDPTSSEDTPDAVLVVKTAIELEFHGASGGTYRIEHSTDLGSWTTVEDNIQGESALVERLHSVDNYSRRFFRVIRTDQ